MATAGGVHVRPGAVSERGPDLLSNRITSQRHRRMIDKSPMIPRVWLVGTYPLSPRTHGVHDRRAVHALYCLLVHC
jgi:hypothetical protein